MCKLIVFSNKISLTFKGMSSLKLPIVLNAKKSKFLVPIIAELATSKKCLV